MRVLRLASLGLMATLACGCVSDSPIGPDAAVPTASPVGSTPYDVYRAVLGDVAGRGGQPLVVLDETRPTLFCAPSVGGQVGEEWRGAVEHFKSQNVTALPLAVGDYFGSLYVVISPQRYRDIFTPSNLVSAWRTFHETYPGASLVTLSAAGVDAHGGRAVVLVGTQCGSLCGEWRDYYLERTGPRWTVTPLNTCRAVS